MNQVLPITCLEKLEKMKLYLRGRSERNYLIFCLGINWGVPIQELLDLQVEDVREREYLIRSSEHLLGKLAISPQLQIEISNYLGDRRTGHLFPSRSGKPLTRRQAYVVLREASDVVGLGQAIGICTLRKTFAYWALQRGISLEVLRKHFKHRSVRNTIQFLGLPSGYEFSELPPIDL